MATFQSDLNNLIASRPTAVKQLFNGFGYNVPKPNAKNVIDAAIIHKDEFVNAFADCFDGVNGFDGSKLAGWLSAGIGALTAGKLILDKTQDKKDNNPVLTKEAESERLFGFDKTIVIAAGAILVLLLLYFAFS